MKNVIAIIVLSLFAITANARGGHSSHSTSHHSSHASHASHVSSHSSKSSSHISKGVSSGKYNPKDFISTKTTKLHIAKISFKLAKTPKPVVSHFKATKTPSSLSKVDKLPHITMPKMKTARVISVHGKTITLPDYTIASSIKHTIHGNGDIGKTTAHKIRVIHTKLIKHKMK